MRRRRWGPASRSSPGRTAPARRTCSRRSTSALSAARRGPPTSASSSASARRPRGSSCTARRHDGPHEISVGLRARRSPKRLRVDGATVERLVDAPERPLVSVFLPDRLDLIKGAPSLRRAHLDQLVVALWPARVQTRRSYMQALAQRNALIARIRSGAGSRARCSSWDGQLAEHGIALMRDRAAAVAVGRRPLPADRRAARARARADGRVPTPLARATDPPELRDELGSRVEQDLQRGFTGPRARTATSSSPSSAAATCGRSGRRASSGSACSRCCWPSARRSPSSAARRR